MTKSDLKEKTELYLDEKLSNRSPQERYEARQKIWRAIDYGFSATEKDCKALVDDFKVEFSQRATDDEVNDIFKNIAL